MKILKKIGGIIFAVVMITGWKLYNKSSHATDYKNQLISICGEDTYCIAAVNNNFQSCYDSNYSLGGKRRAARLNLNEFTDCINQKSGYLYFAVQKDEK